MTKKRTLALVLSALWIALCAVSVFATDMTAQTFPTNNTRISPLRLDCSRSDIERIPAEAFDDMHLTELLNITMESDNDSFSVSNLLNTVEQALITNPQTVNAQATNDFMQLIGTNANEKIVGKSTAVKTAPESLSTNLDTTKRKTNSQTLARKR